MFKRSGFLSHSEGPGEAAFDWRGSEAKENYTPTKTCDRSIFIHPVQWMKDSIVGTEGKVLALNVPLNIVIFFNSESINSRKEKKRVTNVIAVTGNIKRYYSDNCTSSFSALMS